MGAVHVGYTLKVCTMPGKCRGDNKKQKILVGVFMSFINIFVLAIVLLISGYALHEMVINIKTAEGCKDCDGVCTRNGGYCIRKKSSIGKRKRDVLLWEYIRKPEGAAEIHRVAVCSDDDGVTCDLRHATYLWVYSFVEEGIVSKAMVSLGDIPLPEKVGHIVNNNVDFLISTGESKESQTSLQWHKIGFQVINALTPDNAIDQAFSGTLRRTEKLRGKTIGEKAWNFFKDSFPVYPYSMKATIYSLLGSVILYVTISIIVVGAIILALHLGDDNVKAAVAISAYVQFFGFFLASRGKKAADKSAKRFEKV